MKTTTLNFTLNQMSTQSISAWSPHANSMLLNLPFKHLIGFFVCVYVEKNCCRLSCIKLIRVQIFNGNQMLFYCYYYCNYVNANFCYCCCWYVMCLHTYTRTIVLWHFVYQFSNRFEKIQQKMIELNIYLHTDTVRLIQYNKINQIVMCYSV